LTEQVATDVGARGARPVGAGVLEAAVRVLRGGRLA